ncbi:DUF6682 family protein [Nitrosospira multiformis]|uniref:DUF6682 family protein n=1 Tax=Nitrosospira multiformis TaxID=1231 RepID=UPI00089D71B7|nr:DUF6682 family protein [Nitrosospira multiformis]SDZ85991.1 hypothetical protein SAMN05216411_102163 [Nitrosospira multiformis]
MPFSYHSIVELARIPLNDDDKTRYPDTVLLSFANQGMLQILKRRPDLFIGSFNNLPDGERALDDAFPLPPIYLQTVADYVTARAEMSDDEHVNSGRAALFMQLFGSEVHP